MKYKTTILSLILLAHAASGTDTTTYKGAPCAANHVVIKVHAPAPTKSGGAVSVLSADYLHSALGLPPAVYITNNQFVEQCGTCAAGQLSAERHLIVQLNGALSVDEALARLENHPLLEYAEPDYVGTGGATVPNDTYYGSQWGHVNIESPNAWDITTGTSSVIVAVLDTGVNATLAEFSGRTVAGYDYANGDADPSDDNGHGTAVASVIGANTDNGSKIAGTDWNCKIMPVKVLDAGNSGLYSWWASGVNFAVANGAKVINLSAGGGSTSSSLVSAIQNAVSQGVIFVTITHNYSSPVVTFPGTLPETITVGATKSNDERASFSNWGPEIDLVAPGTNIYGIYNNGATYVWWGTSFAAPHVAGVASLLASVRPDINNEEVRTLLCAGAEDQVGDAGEDTPGFDNYYGWGRLNAWHTLQLATEPAEVSRMYDFAIMTWNTPANASSKQPYKVETTPDLSSPWVSLPASNITYSPGQAEFVIDPLDGKGFYRPSVSLQ